MLHEGWPYYHGSWTMGHDMVFKTCRSVTCSFSTFQFFPEEQFAHTSQLRHWFSLTRSRRNNSILIHVTVLQTLQASYKISMGENESNPDDGDRRKRLGTGALVFIVLTTIFCTSFCCMLWKKRTQAARNSKQDDSFSGHEAAPCMHGMRVTPDDQLPFAWWMQKDTARQIPASPKVCASDHLCS
jgi:hypothetical protein